MQCTGIYFTLMLWSWLAQIDVLGVSRANPGIPLMTSQRFTKLVELKSTEMTLLDRITTREKKSNSAFLLQQQIFWLKSANPFCCSNLED